MGGETVSGSMSMTGTETALGGEAAEEGDEGTLGRRVRNYNGQRRVWV